MRTGKHADVDLPEDAFWACIFATLIIGALFFAVVYHDSNMRVRHIEGKAKP